MGLLGLDLSNQGSNSINGHKNAITTTHKAWNMSPRAALDYSRLSVMILLSVIFYNEFLVYFNTYRSWPELEQKRMLKILFVADPQIQGKNDMGNWLLGIITRWDSDRYLSKTF